MLKNVFLAVILSSLSCVAAAAPAGPATGPYVGAEFATSEIDRGEYRQAGFGLLLGYQLSRHVGMELSHRKLTSLLVYADDDASQNTVSVTGTIPLTKWSINGRLGYSRTKYREFIYGNDNPNVTESGALVAIGAGFHFMPRLALRLEVQQVAGSGVGSSVSIRYTF